jgi:hypothetical protein
MPQVLVIAHAPDGDYIIGQSSANTMDTHPKTVLVLLPGVTLFRPIPDDATHSYVRSSLEHDIILTYDSTYIGYAVPGIFSWKDG